MKLSELASKLGGRLVGEDADISGVSSLKDAKPGELSYLALHSYREQVLETKASGVLVVAEVNGCPCAQIVCNDPHLAFTRAMRTLFPAKDESHSISDRALILSDGIGEGSTVYPFAYIGRESSIGRNAVIHPHVFIGDRVRIGDDCIIHSHVSIREDTQIGDRVILQDGCRIGSDGYGFAKDENGRHLKIPQVGRVVIEDDVEIGANCCVDRATFAETRIGRGTKLDNLVQVGHNVKIGEDSLLVAQVGIAGTTRIGNQVTLAGQVGVSGHISIGDGATIGGKSGVTRDVPPQEVYVGFPAIPHRQWKAIQRALKRIIQNAGDEEES